MMDKEFTKLLRLAEALEVDVLSKDEEGTSIKDVVVHRAHWIGLFLGWYNDGQAGKEVFFPAKGYKWNELKRYNRELRAESKDVDWPGAMRRLKNAHKKLVCFLEELSDKELYGGAMKGANNKWTPGRWAEAAGPSHYRSAAKYIRMRQRSAS